MRRMGVRDCRDVVSHTPIRLIGPIRSTSSHPRDEKRCIRLKIHAVEEAYTDFQPIDLADLQTVFPIFAREVRVWPGIMAEWEKIGPAAFTSEGYPEHRLSLILGSTDVTFRTGQVFLAPAFKPSTYQWSGDLEVISLLFRDSWLRAVAAEMGVKQPDHLELSKSIDLQDEFLAHLLRTFQKEIVKPQIGSRLLIDSLTQALAVYLIRRYSDRKLQNGRILSVPKWRIRRAQDFIRDNLTNPISLQEIAHAAGDVSPYHFSRLFKQATGIAPYQYLIECRVLAAQELLRANRRLSLAEIAFRCGFADQSSFTRCFRERTGVTPKQFRDE
jgi:AraC family transcriptional regulator